MAKPGKRLTGRPKVVVLGAGFAGLGVVRGLAGRGADVTVVDRSVSTTFQPLLYQVATGGLNPGDVTYPIRGLAGRLGVRFRRGTVTGLDTDGREVLLDSGERLAYDYLVVATGVVANHFGVPGAAERSVALYTRTQAVQLRDELLRRLERLAGRTDTAMAVVVVGGGPTGVEMAGTLAELRTGALPVLFPELDPHRLQVVLVEQGDALLAPFTPGLRDYTLAQLQRRGVDVRLGTAIREVHEDAVVLEPGGRIPAGLVVWAAGVTAPAAVASWGLPQGRGGRILVTPDLRVVGHDRVFAVGDIAATAEDPLPQLAQPAMQGGRHVARQVVRLAQGLPTEPFRYRDKGIMATIGKRAAVAELYGRVRLRGTVAWVVWVALHIGSLLGGRNRASTFVNLAWRYLARPGGSLIVGDPPEDRLASDGGGSDRLAA